MTDQTRPSLVCPLCGDRVGAQLEPGPDGLRCALCKNKVSRNRKRRVLLSGRAAIARTQRGRWPRGCGG